MTGLWTGQYWYATPGEAPMAFVATISDNAGSLSGTTTEASEFFVGVDERADIRGTRSGTYVSFHKHYDGNAAYGHSVVYQGMLSSDGQRVEGRWSIDDCSAAFVMSRSLQSFHVEELEERVGLDFTLN